MSEIIFDNSSVSGNITISKGSFYVALSVRLHGAGQRRQRCVCPVSAFDRSGISTLDEGQAVVVDVVEGRKGLETARVRSV
jgi:hypothetical protein